jgi:5'-deoxynucleotidase YfbR-like HD superfamily hydrolase
MTWMLTATGTAFELGRPRKDDVQLDDIAHHLALINRFNGATTRPYSVAEHSLLVAEIFERQLGMANPVARLAALMHDAHECYLGDITTPVKRHLGEECHVLEASLERTVQERYGLRTAAAAYRHQIRDADLIALATERRDLMPPTHRAWAVLEGIEPVEWINLNDQAQFTWQDWRRTFTDLFNELNYERVELMGQKGAA